MSRFHRDNEKKNTLQQYPIQSLVDEHVQRLCERYKTVFLQAELCIREGNFPDVIVKFMDC